MSDRRFFGREAELSKLDDVWNREGFQFVAVWGRRRVGKTSILQEFCKRRKAILFPASASDLRTNLERLTEATAGVLMPGMPLPPFTDFRNAMLFISSFSKTERLALVIDEYPYLVGKNQSIQTDLQNLMDHELSDTNLMIVLAGSSMSFMEHQVLGYESPLYGRRTAQIKVEPFTYRETCGFLRDYSPEDCLTAYAVTGGIPAYLSKFDQRMGVADNIEMLFFDRSEYMYEEPSNLLKQEVRDCEVYNSIIKALANGCTKLNEISQRLGMESGLVTRYIDNLIELGIVRRERPVNSPASRDTRYSIADSMFRFWFTFVDSNAVPIARGDRGIYRNNVEAHMSDFLAPTFEEVCTRHALFDSDDGFQPVIGGRWWGSNPKLKCREEIDIVAFSADGDSVLFGECKYRNEETRLDVLNELIRKSMLIPAKMRMYSVYSKSAFSDGIRKEAERIGARLVTLDEVAGRNG